MSNSQQVVKAIYAAFAKGDVPTFLGHLDPGIVWNEAEGFPYADRNPYVGVEALMAGVFARLAEDWADFRVVLGEIAGGPEVVTMLGRLQGTCKATGQRLDAQCVHLWWLRGGKAVRFQELVDTAAVARAIA